MKRVRLTLDIVVNDERKLRAFARRMYRATWGNALNADFPNAGLEEYLYEALVASNGTPESPVDYGIELGGHSLEILK